MIRPCLLALALLPLPGVGTAILASGPPAASPVVLLKRDLRPLGRPETDDQLAGSWWMTLPRGFRHAITLVPVSEGRYRLLPGVLNSSGVYELRGNRLVIIEPSDRRLLGFEWELREGVFRLVAQPPVGKTGSNYLGATLARPAQ